MDEEPLSDPPPTVPVTQLAVGRAGVISCLKDAKDRQRQAEIDQLVWVAKAADAWSWVDNALPDDSPPALFGERLWTYGGDGTPEASEFLTHELGPALGISPDAAGLLVADVLDLRHRLPLLWEATITGLVAGWIARKVAARTRRAELSLDDARLLDAHLTPKVPGWTPGRILSLTDRLIVSVAPHRADQRAAAARSDRFAAFGRPEDGATHLLARLDSVASRDLDATLTQLAHSLAGTGDERPVRELRAAALGLLADPARAAALLSTGTLGRPTPGRQVSLVVHLGPGQLASGTGASSDELSPLTRHQLDELLAGARRVKVLPVLDPLQEDCAPTYRVPDRMKHKLILRNEYSAYPWSQRRSTSAGVQFDHTRNWPEGTTTMSNLAPLDLKSHQAKTVGGFRAIQIRPGVLRWRTPTGQVSWMTPHGTFDQDPATNPVLTDIRQKARAAIRHLQPRVSAAHATAAGGVNSPDEVCPF